MKVYPEIIIHSKVDAQKILGKGTFEEFALFQIEENKKDIQTACSKVITPNESIQSATITAPGILQVEAKDKNQGELIISTIIHGDEIGTLGGINTLIKKVLLGSIEVKRNILFVLGNLEARKRLERFLEYDLNRLFSNSKEILDKAKGSLEYKRVKEILESVKDFELNGLIHFDLHQTPFPAEIFENNQIPREYTCSMEYGNDPVIDSVSNLMGIDGIIRYDNELLSTTFTGYTSTKESHSATFELGKAGKTNLTQLKKAFAILSYLIEGLEVDDLNTKSEFKRNDEQVALEEYRVEEQPLKKAEDYHFAEEYKDFQYLLSNQPYAYENNNPIYPPKEDCRILFPISEARIGERTCVLLTRK